MWVWNAFKISQKGSSLEGLLVVSSLLKRHTSKVSSLYPTSGHGEGRDVQSCSSLLATRRKVELKDEGILVLDAIFESTN